MLELLVKKNYMSKLAGFAAFCMLHIWNKYNIFAKKILHICLLVSMYSAVRRCRLEARGAAE